MTVIPSFFPPVICEELREIRGALGNKVERGEVEAIVEHVVARIAQR